MAGRRSTAVLMALTAILPAAAGPDTTAGPALAVEVLYGPGGGPERFRVDFEDALLVELRLRSCFPAVLDNGDDAALLFRVFLNAPVEEQHNSLSLPGSLRNEQEQGGASTTYRIRIHADMEILLPESRELFRGKRIRREVSYRPTFAWEDGSAETRDKMIRSLAFHVAGYACKANGSKLRKRLAGQPL